MTKLKDFKNDERLFTYKVAHDGGSAPNPFHELCTLAICKPAIRRVAKVGDVIVGLACGDDESRIVYCMVVDQSVSWKDYIEKCNNDKELNGKIPKNENDQGDCIWKSADNSCVLDSWSGHEGEDDFIRDITGGKNVLIGRAYWYFGKGNIHEVRLPDNLKNIIPGRGHRSNSNKDSQEDFVKFFNETLNYKNITSTGKLGTPALEPEKADKKTCSRCRIEERESDAIGEEYSYGDKLKPGLRPEKISSVE